MQKEISLMSLFRPPLLIVATVAGLLSACSQPSDAPTNPATPMPGIDYAAENSTVHGAARAMRNHTWLWTRGPGPVQIHYSTADGRDLVWMVGQRRIFQGEWMVQNTSDSSGQQITQICLRYPGVNYGGLSATLTCRPAGTFLGEMQQREGGDPLRMNGRTQALFVIDKPPANLAEIEGRVASIKGLSNY